MTDGPYRGQDAAYLRELEAERNGLVAPEVTYYSLRKGANVDPLYNEPKGAFSFRQPRTLHGVVQFVDADQREDSVRDESYSVAYDASLFIAMDEWTAKWTDGDADIRPKVGDVVTGFGKVFDVVSAGQDGAVLDTDEAVGFNLKLKRRERFGADRKLT